MAVIDWTSPVAPTTQFQCYANIAETDTAGRRWRVRFTLRCYNKGNTTSFNNDFGFHRGHGGGSISPLNLGTLVANRQGDPFLVSGVPNGTLRWEVVQDIWVPANSNGYWSGTSTAYPFHQQVSSTSWSNTQSSTLTLPRISAPPGAPGTPAVTSVGETTVGLSWTAPSNTGTSAITGYKVQRSTTSGFTTNVQTVTLGNVLSTTITGLSTTVKYYFRVLAVNGSGDGAWSGTREATTVTVPTAPPTPVLLSKTTTAINLSLVDPSYTGGALTERAGQLSTSEAFTTILATSATTTPSFTGLNRATTYYYRWRARNAVGWGPYSPILTITTNSSVPSVPTAYGVSDLASTTAYTTMPAVADNGGSELVNVRVQLNTFAPATEVGEYTEGGYRPLLLSDLSPGQAYEFRMAVANASGWSEWGDWVVFTTRTDVPGPPGTVTVTSVTESTCVVSWDAPFPMLGATIISYRIRVARNKAWGAGLQTFTVDSTTQSQVVTGLQASSLHYAQVWAIASAGPGSMSLPVEFTTTGTPPIPRSIWMRIAGTYRPGYLWAKLLGFYPNTMYPSDPNAYPSFGGGNWVRLIPWQKISGTWRKL